MLRRVVVVVLLWVGVSSAQPAFPDKNARLVELAQVWAKVKVFHPYLGYKDLDWDAALVAAIPKVEAATTLVAYRAALQDMLGKLGDPVTRMIDRLTPPVPPSTLPPPTHDALVAPATPMASSCNGSGSSRRCSYARRSPASAEARARRAASDLASWLET